jgi:hypothetical protein
LIFASESRTIINQNHAFDFDCERCRLTRALKTVKKNKKPLWEKWRVKNYRENYRENYIFESCFKR